MKAYATRVGAGPFPTELFDQYGERLTQVGHEFGSVTGRRRRCGWFDSVALRQTIVHSSVSRLCITKLDVLDGFDTGRVGVGYRNNGRMMDETALSFGSSASLEPVYEEMPGWKQSMVGIQEYRALPGNSRRYLERLEQLVRVPIGIISTGPERNQTIVLRIRSAEPRGYADAGGNERSIQETEEVI